MSAEEELHPDDVQQHLREVQALLSRHKLVENLVHRQDMPRHELVEGLVHKQHLAELQARLGHTTSDAAMIYQHAAKGRDQQLARALSRLASG